MTRRLLANAAAAFALSAAPAFAHLDPAAHGSMMTGITHPLSSLDHVLVMVAVGLWAAQIGGRALLVVPAAFVATMALGFALALSGLPLPFVEPAILASIVALGLLVAMAVRVPAAAGAAVVGVFALFHGYAHGGELGAATAWTFGLGFALSTAALHAAGIALGLIIGRDEQRPRRLPPARRGDGDCRCGPLRRRLSLLEKKCRNPAPKSRNCGF